MGSCCGGSPLEPRRGFLAKLSAMAGGALAIVTPLGAGLVSYLNPLRQKPATGAPVRVGMLDSFGLTPTKITIRGDKVDAWSRQANVPIGAIWVRKTPDGQVEAYQASCPHAGCTIAVQTVSEADGQSVPQFYCPCHLAFFDLSGRQLPNSTASPRDLDALTVEVNSAGEVWVTYQTFRAGSSQKIADA